MSFTPHQTPHSYYDEQREAVASYVAWITKPRVRVAPVDSFTTDSKQPTKREIKTRILSAI